ncbi:MAG: SRPBCC family protein [Firmicutes bacterium]|nr:SRPBCC family protein [Bacillota bacterium]
MTEALITYSDSTIIDAPADKVYAVITDITNMGKFSPECKECYWESDNHSVGGWLVGKNITPERTWETRSLVTKATENQEFTFTTGGDRVEWSYKLSQENDQTLLTETWTVFPPFKDYFLERYGPDTDVEEILKGRLQTTKAGIKETLSNIKTYIESDKSN